MGHSKFVSPVIRLYQIMNIFSELSSIQTNFDTFINSISEHLLMSELYLSLLETRSTIIYDELCQQTDLQRKSILGYQLHNIHIQITKESTLITLLREAVVLVKQL